MLEASVWQIYPPTVFPLRYFEWSAQFLLKPFGWMKPGQPQNFLKFTSLGPFGPTFWSIWPSCLAQLWCHVLHVTLESQLRKCSERNKNWHRCGQSGMSSNMFFQNSSIHSTHLQPCSLTRVCGGIFGLVKKKTRVCTSAFAKHQTAKTGQNGKNHVIVAWRRKLCTFGFPRYHVTL